MQILKVILALVKTLLFSSAVQVGQMYRFLNCFRSTISSVHLPVDRFQVGQHPLVSRSLKGVFNSRPPMPRYKDIWEVSKVLRYLQSLGPNESLSLKDLTIKLAMLLALSLANRSSHLVRLRLSLRGGGTLQTESAFLLWGWQSSQTHSGLVKDFQSLSQCSKKINCSVQ